MFLSFSSWTPWIQGNTGHGVRIHAGCQSITRYIFTPRGNLAPPIRLPACFRKQEILAETHPHRHEENMLTPQTVTWAQDRTRDPEAVRPECWHHHSSLQSLDHFSAPRHQWCSTIYYSGYQMFFFVRSGHTCWWGSRPRDQDIFKKDFLERHHQLCNLETVVSFEALGNFLPFSDY